jgi:hypothetical protein
MFPYYHTHLKEKGRIFMMKRQTSTSNNNIHENKIKKFNHKQQYQHRCHAHPAAAAL